MPLYDYKCPDGHVTEVLLRVNEIPKAMVCHCGQLALKQIGMPALTPGRWGDQTGTYGVNGYYDKSLGATYSNSMQRDKIMRKKGLIRKEDLPQHFIEDTMEKEAKQSKQHEQNVKTFKSNLKKHDPGRAIAETFSVSEMRKQGTLTDSRVKD